MKFIEIHTPQGPQKMKITNVFRESSSGQFFFIAITNMRWIMGELVCLNVLKMINPLSADHAIILEFAPEGQVFNFMNLEFKCLTREEVDKIFPYDQYVFLFQQGEKYYVVTDKTKGLFDYEGEEVDGMIPIFRPISFEEVDISTNMDVDSILDKINEIGWDWLTPVERKYLEKQSSSSS